MQSHPCSFLNSSEECFLKQQKPQKLKLRAFFSFFFCYMPSKSECSHSISGLNREYFHSSLDMVDVFYGCLDWTLDCACTADHVLLSCFVMIEVSCWGLVLAKKKSEESMAHFNHEGNSKCAWESMGSRAQYTAWDCWNEKSNQLSPTRCVGTLWCQG